MKNIIIQYLEKISQTPASNTGDSEMLNVAFSIASNDPTIGPELIEYIDKIIIKEEIESKKRFTVYTHFLDSLKLKTFNSFLMEPLIRGFQLEKEMVPWVEKYWDYFINYQKYYKGWLEDKDKKSLQSITILLQNLPKQHPLVVEKICSLIKKSDLDYTAKEINEILKKTYEKNQKNSWFYNSLSYSSNLPFHYSLNAVSANYFKIDITQNENLKKHVIQKMGGEDIHISNLYTIFNTFLNHPNWGRKLKKNSLNSKKKESISDDFLKKILNNMLYNEHPLDFIPFFSLYNINITKYCKKKNNIYDKEKNLYEAIFLMTSSYCPIQEKETVPSKYLKEIFFDIKLEENEYQKSLSNHEDKKNFKLKSLVIITMKCKTIMLP